jgi:hypothetical protein
MAMGATIMRVALVVAVACVGCVLISSSLGRTATFELASSSEMREINWAYDQDSTTASLVAKNDDGHTKIWNAADGTRDSTARM